MHYAPLREKRPRRDARVAARDGLPETSRAEPEAGSISKRLELKPPAVEERTEVSLPVEI